jgi:hypothetical protein
VLRGSLKGIFYAGDVRNTNVQTTPPWLVIPCIFTMELKQQTTLGAVIFIQENLNEANLI